MTTQTTAAQRSREEAEAAGRSRHFVLNREQRAFVMDDAHKYPAFIGGIGSGKSYAGAVKALRKAIDHPGSLGVIGAPTYPQLRDSTMRTVFEIFPPALRAKLIKDEGLLTLANGSEILFRSMDDPDNRRGPSLTWFWLDEGPLCGYYAWQVMKGRLRQTSDGVQGWITGTPHGQDQFYLDFEKEPMPGHALYRASTVDNAHNLPPGYVEDLGYSGQFALQEVEGLFVSFEGLVYEFITELHGGEWPGFWKDPSGNQRPPARRIGGVDWGYTNPSVALPIYVDGDDRAWIIDEYYMRQTGYAGVSAACVEFTKTYGIETWYCGPDEPEHIADLNALLQREGCAARAVAANDDINSGLKTVRKHLARRGDGTTGFRLSARCANTRAEFRSYSYPPTRPNQLRDIDEKPLKKLDHAMDAVRYALHSELGALDHAAPLTTWSVSIEQDERVPPSYSDQGFGGTRLLRKVF